MAIKQTDQDGADPLKLGHIHWRAALARTVWAISSGLILVTGALVVAGGTGGDHKPEPDYLAPPPVFRSAVLHFTNVSYTYHEDAIDHYNGVEIEGDIWVRTDSNGKALLFRAEYRLRDGTLIQEMTQTPTDLMVGDEQGCNAGPTDDRALQSVLPVYIEMSRVAESGMTKGGEYRLDQVTPPDGLGAEMVIGPPESLIYWQGNPLAKPATYTSYAFDGATGRLVGERTVTSGADDKVIAEFRITYSDVAVFVDGNEPAGALSGDEELC